MDNARIEVEKAMRAGKYQEAGELQYKKIPELEAKLKEAEANSANAESTETGQLSFPWIGETGKSSAI